VFERGHEINPRLRELTTVVLLPHMGSATVEGRIEMGDERIDVGEVAHEITQGQVDTELVRERLADLGEQQRIKTEFEIRGVSDQFLGGNPGAGAL
jgi:hypothetical protein